MCPLHLGDFIHPEKTKIAISATHLLLITDFVLQSELLSFAPTTQSRTGLARRSTASQRVLKMCNARSHHWEPVAS